MNIIAYIETACLKLKKILVFLHFSGNIIDFPNFILFQQINKELV